MSFGKLLILKLFLNMWPTTKWFLWTWRPPRVWPVLPPSKRGFSYFWQCSLAMAPKFTVFYKIKAQCDTIVVVSLEQACLWEEAKKTLHPSHPSFKRSATTPFPGPFLLCHWTESHLNGWAHHCSWSHRNSKSCGADWQSQSMGLRSIKNNKEWQNSLSYMHF